MKNKFPCQYLCLGILLGTTTAINGCVTIEHTGVKPGAIHVGTSSKTKIFEKLGYPVMRTYDGRFYLYVYRRKGEVLWGLEEGDSRSTLFHTIGRVLIEFDDSGVVVNKLIHKCKKQQTDGICDQRADISMWMLIGKLHGNEYVADHRPKNLPPPVLVPLLVAAFHGDTEVMRSLIEQGADLKASDRHGNTALHIASTFGSQSAVKILLPMIDDLNAGNDLGYTALHYAAEDGHIEIMQLLITNGADVNQQNAFGQTPLHAAAQFPDKAPAKLLLAAGADPDIRDVDGLLPIDIAKQKQNKRVSRFLNTQAHQN